MTMLLRFLYHFALAVLISLLNRNWNIAHVQSISVDLLQLSKLDPLGKTILQSKNELARTLAIFWLLLVSRFSKNHILPAEQPKSVHNSLLLCAMVCYKLLPPYLFQTNLSKWSIIAYAM